jgi:hypothetical protein
MSSSRRRTFPAKKAPQTGPVKPSVVDPQQRRYLTALASAINPGIKAEWREWTQVLRGKRNQSAMFGFARRLRDSPEFDFLAAEEARDKVHIVLRGKWAMAFPMHDDPESAFLLAWPQTLGYGMLEAAVREVDRRRPALRGYERYVAVHEVQYHRRGYKPTLQSREAWASALEVDPHTITAWRKRAEAEGILTLARAADHLRGIAAYYQYHGPGDRHPPVGCFARDFDFSLNGTSPNSSKDAK